MKGEAFDTFRTLAIITGMVLLGSFLFGCAHTPKVLSVSASALVAIDDEVAPLLAEAHVVCIESSQTLEEWRECMRPWRRVADGMAATRHALRGAQSAYDVYQAGGSRSAWLAAAGCAAQAAAEVIAALDVVGIDPPDRLLDLVSLPAALGLTCVRA